MMAQKDNLNCQKILDNWAKKQNYKNWTDFCESNDGHLTEKEARDLSAYTISKTLTWAIKEVEKKQDKKKEGGKQK